MHSSTRLNSRPCVSTEAQLLRTQDAEIRRETKRNRQRKQYGDVHHHRHPISKRVVGKGRIEGRELAAVGQPSVYEQAEGVGPIWADVSRAGKLRLVASQPGQPTHPTLEGAVR